MAGVKKNAARQGATIVFVDESGFSERPSVQCTWAPRGQTPVLEHRFGPWKHLSAIGGTAYSPQARRTGFCLDFADTSKKADIHSVTYNRNRRR